MTPVHGPPCAHDCCGEPDDGPPHTHRPWEDPRSCPDCIEVRKQARPSKGAQELEDRAKAFGKRFGRPDRPTRRDPR